MTRIDVAQTWRDQQALADIRSEIKVQEINGWKAWEILLPPELVWPVINEICESQIAEWSPMLDGVGVSIGAEHEIAIRFVLPKLQTSPVMVRTMEYKPSRICDIENVEVRYGSTVRN